MSDGALTFDPRAPGEAAERLFRGVVEQSLTGIYMIQDNRFVYVNPKFAEIFGYSITEILELQSLAVLIAESDRALVAENLRRRLDGEVNDVRYTFRGLRKDGTPLVVEIHGAGTEMNGQRTVIGTLVDITEQRSAEVALRESESRFRAMFECSPIGTALLDLDARYIAVNPAFEAMLGYANRDLVGHHVWQHYPDQSAATPLAYLDQLLTNERKSYRREQRFVRRDGREIHADVTAALVRGEDGKAQFGLSMVEDVTERRQMESQLRQSQKMEAVGRFAGGIAHDFNNTLAAIGAYAQILFDDLSASDPRRADAEEILKATSRASGLTRQLLTFSRKKVLEYQLLDLRTVVTDFETLLRPLLPSTIRLVTHIPTGCVTVNVDRTQVDQVLMNLALNARDAMPDGGTIEIDVSVRAAATTPGTPAARVTASEAVLSVVDTGVGISEDTRSRLFEPFFTTKIDGNGTGLGLATVYAIAQQAGGTVSVESQLGRGSRFTVKLPLASGPTTSGNVVSSVTDRSTAGQHKTTILLAEDEKGVREAARRLLERAGFDVITACNGIEALEKLNAFRGEIRILMTDIMMPGMGGIELIERAKQLAPQLRVILMSGYADVDISDPRALADEILEKPFSAEALVRTANALSGGNSIASS